MNERSPPRYPPRRSPSAGYSTIRSSRLALVALAATVFIPSGAQSEFVDATAGSGLFGNQPTWGAQAVDIDGDGDTDLLNGHHYFNNFIFTNVGPGSFSAFGIPQIFESSADRHGFLWADLDNDGVVDVVSSHGGNAGCGCPGDSNELWEGLGAGLFDLVTLAGGMEDPIGRGRAFSAADIDGDGDLDLYHAKAPLATSPNSLYRNEGVLTFTDIAGSLGLDETLGTAGGLFADYDDDGDPDLLVGGDEFERPTKLFRNDGAQFTEVTSAALGAVPVIAFADWGDFDNDQDLDLAVCEGNDGVWDTWGVDGTDYWLFAHHRYAEDGVDAFRFETPGDDPTARIRWRGAIANDLVFLGRLGEHPSPTQGSVTLTDAYVGEPLFTPGVDHGLFCWRESPGGAWQIHVSAPPGTFGNFSMEVTSTGPVVNPTATNLEVPSLPQQSARVFVNEGGRLVEATSALGITPAANARAVQWVDFDNDGDLDLHQMNRGTVDTGNEMDCLWRNDGATFSQLAGADWAPGLSDYLTDGGVWADWDEDGDPDLLLQEGGGPVFFSTGTPALYYRNDGPAGHWLGVSLGLSPERSTPVGAKVTAHAGTQTVHRRVQANGWEGFQRPLALHFGLGAATVVDSLVIVWPSGAREVLGPLAADRKITVTGGEDPTAVAEVGTAGQGIEIGWPRPQPARAEQELVLVLPGPKRFTAAVFDVAGRRVRALFEGVAPAGTTIMSWDGRDESGRKVTAGVYFVRAMGDLRFERKAVRIR